MEIVLLGSGNVATHLKNILIQKSEINITQWYSRSFEGTVSEDGIPITASLADIKTADLYLLAVSDDAIPELSAQLPPAAFVVHTAGNVALNALENAGAKGVFYPLQTFSKKRTPNFSTIPICLEADSKEGLQRLQYLGQLFDAPLHLVNSSERMHLHLAAVFANNFTNHLYGIAEAICLQKNVSFDLLQPLIQETAAKILTLSPNKAQTGPAKRKDINSIKKHLDLLEKTIDKEIYTLLTKSIQEHEQ